MVDIAYNTLEIGDLVAFCKAGYSELGYGRIKNLTPKGATIVYENHNHDLITINRASYQIAKLWQK